MLLNLPSWGEMARLQLKYLRDKEILNFSEMDQLSSLDPKKQLSIAKEIAHDNNVVLDLTKDLIGHSESNSIYKKINDIGCVCVTTNYDELLAPRYKNIDDGSEISASVSRIYQREKFLSAHLDNPGTVIHLHGSVSDEDSMVVTTRDYLEHYDNPNVKEFLNKLFEIKTILFIGYRLEEVEILEHILRRGDIVNNRKERKRFILQGYFKNQKFLYEKLYKYYEKSFGVYILGYIRDYKDHKQQEKIIDAWESEISVNPRLLRKDLEEIDRVLSYG